MTRLKVTERPAYKIALSVATWAAIGICGFIVLTAQTVAKNAQLGRQAYEQVDAIKTRQDSICKQVQQIESNQRVTNVTLQKDVEQVIGDISDIKRMVEQLYINGLERTY